MCMCIYACVCMYIRIFYMYVYMHVCYVMLYTQSCEKAYFLTFQTLSFEKYAFKLYKL